MAFSFVAAGSFAGNATTTTQAITAPTCVEHDILIAFLINKSAVIDAGISAPDSTWTQIVQGAGDCTAADEDHTYAVFWKRATGSGGSFTFTKTNVSAVLFGGVIGVWRGQRYTDPIDSSTPTVQVNVAAADNVTFAAFDPTSTTNHAIFAAFYGRDATTFAAAMSSDTNPDCTTQIDVESSTGTGCSIAVTSGDNDGSNIASRTWASSSTVDAGSTGVVFSIVLATLTAYTLPSIENTAVGTFKVKLFSSIVGLTVPTANTILSVGKREQIADIEIGITQLGSLELRIKDDYTVYTEGFWYKVLGSSCQIRLYLTEDAVDLFYFYGVPQEETVEWTEFFLGSTYSREVTLSLLSVAYSILGTTTVDLVTEVLANVIDTGERNENHPAWYISVKGLFSAMLSASDLNSSYSASDASFVYNSIDFSYKQGASSFVLDDVVLCTHYWDVVGLQTITEHWVATRLDSSVSPSYLPSKFALLKDLIKHLSANFGVIMVMDYSTTTERHLIKLVQRGRAYSATLTFGSKEKRSTITKSYDLLGDATRVTAIHDSSIFTWFSKKFLTTNPSTAAVPNYVNFDVDFISVFQFGSIDGTAPSQDLSRYLYVLVTGEMEVIAQVSYWSYLSNAGILTSSMQEAIAGYPYWRFTNVFTLIRRTYGIFKGNDGSTNSFTNIGILRRTSINDGNGAANYYANKALMNPETEETEIDWVRESTA